MKLIVTGASGFVGSAAVQSLAGAGWSVIAQSRGQLPPSLLPASAQALQAPLDDQAAWQSVLQGCDAVLHTAARVHQVQDASVDPLADYRAVNTVPTLRLARLAAEHGVKRFVFLSSIKVNGEFTIAGQAFHADDAANPADPYGISKHEAEMGLRQIAAETGLQVVIVRPPLVYGPGVRANFLTLMRWLQRGLPLPLGAVHNQRSLIGLDNLVSLLSTALTHPAAANQTFLASDAHDVSTTELLRELAVALQRPARLIPVPSRWLETALTLASRGAIAQRLCGNLAVDITKTQRLLQWHPPHSLAEGLRVTAQHFLASGR